ncbi:MAG: catalase [Bdellovibrionia bacterium]
MKSMILQFVVLSLFANPAAQALGLGEEAVPDNEAAAVERANKTTEKFLEEMYAGGNARRGVHPISHGCVKAIVKVKKANEMPDWAAKGIFKPEAEYKAWIRFSNASSRPKPDKNGDSRGFAIKILNVEGERMLPDDKGRNQDFMMNSFPVFFARSAWDYADFIDSFLLKGSFLPYLFPKFYDYRTWRLRELQVLRGIGGVRINSLFNATFYSITPFRNGPDQRLATKHAVTRCDGVKPVEFDDSDERYLTKALRKDLDEKDQCFTMGLQKQVDAEKMPVEDPTVLWDENLSRFYPVATISIPKELNKGYDSAEQKAFCENLTFNPWQGIQDHRPIGGINRLRLSNYVLSNRVRHRLNQAEIKEPAPDWKY